MAKRSNLKSAGWKAAKITYRTADKAAGGLFRWASTDHTGFARRLSNMPKMGFFETIRFALTHALIAIAGAVLTGIWVYFLIAHVLPFLISGSFE